MTITVRHIKAILPPDYSVYEWYGGIFNIFHPLSNPDGEMGFYKRHTGELTIKIIRHHMVVMGRLVDNIYDLRDPNTDLEKIIHRHLENMIR